MKKRWIALTLIFFSAMAFAGCTTSKSVQKSPTGRIKFEYNVPGHVFTEKKGVEFTLKGTAKGICRVYTYDRKKVFEKEMSLPGKVSIPKLPNGYYFVEFTSSDKKITKSDFAVVPDPSDRKVSYDAPYCMDIALGGREKIDEWVELTYLMGLKFVRDRFHHARTEPAPGKYNWNVYGSVPEKLFEKGIHVSATWHDFARWAKNDPKMALAKDLKLPFEFAKKLASKYKGKINIWEFWNEPDLAFTKDGTWEYASMLKAAYLGFKAGNPQVPVMNGSFCIVPWDNDFARAVMRNDLADYMDIFNFHIYDALCKYPEIVYGWKNFLKDNGLEGQMMWITENGTNAEGPAAIPPKKGKYYHQSPGQEMIWAEFIPKSQILWQNLGVARTFFFILRPLNERRGRKEWGIVRRDKSVKPGYAAFSTLLNELGSAKCLGEVDLGKEMRGFLYQQTDGSRTLAFWSISELDTVKEHFKTIPPFKDLKEKSFEINGDSATIIDSFGTPHTYKGQNGKITIPSVRLTSYLRNAPEMKITKPAAEQGIASPRKRKMDRTIVLRILPSGDYKLSPSCCSMLINDQAKDKSLVLQVANFSDKTKDVEVTVQGCELPGFPAKITLPPYSEKITEIKTSAEKLASGKYDLVFKGTSDGLPISQLVFPFRVTGDKMLDSVPVAGSEDPKKWRANSSGKMNITFDEPEQSLRFDAEFSKKVKDKWAYPFFDLPEGLKKCSAISFDIKIDLDGEKALRHVLMLNTAKKHRYVRFHPKNHQWTNIIFEFSGSGIDPKELKSIQIGMGVKSQSHITWYVRNIRIME